MNESDPKTREIMDKSSYEPSFPLDKNHTIRPKSIVSVYNKLSHMKQRWWIFKAYQLQITSHRKSLSYTKANPR